MDSWLGVPILCFLLLFSQLISAKDSSSGATSYDAAEYNTSQGIDQQRDILRLLMMAAQRNSGPNLQFRRNNWGIPYRPVRRIGSEFLGKRSDIQPFYDDEDIEKRSRMGSEFLGKRGMGSEFLGKRGMGSEFLGKRGMGSEFLGKRGMGSEFLGKRGMVSEFLGKRGTGSEFLGKRGTGSEFLGKRGTGSEFLGKRGMGSEFLGKRGMGSEFLGKRGMGSEFLGKRDSYYDAQSELPEMSYYDENPHVDSLFPLYVTKRGMGSEFLGKRAKPGTAYDYNWKRGRLGSEFLGKRSVVPEQVYPYLQTDSDFDVRSSQKVSNAEDKADDNAVSSAD